MDGFSLTSAQVLAITAVAVAIFGFLNRNQAQIINRLTKEIEDLEKSIDVVRHEVTKAHDGCAKSIEGAIKDFECDIHLVRKEVMPRPELQIILDRIQLDIRTTREELREDRNTAAKTRHDWNNRCQTVDGRSAENSTRIGQLERECKYAAEAATANREALAKLRLDFVRAGLSKRDASE
jgi:chromosome segregation ATPase